MSNGGTTHVTASVDSHAIGNAVGSAIRSEISHIVGEIRNVTSAVNHVTDAVNQAGSQISNVTEAIQIVDRTIERGISGIGQKVDNLQKALFDQLVKELTAIEQLEKEVYRSIQANVQGQLSQFIGDLEGLKKAVQIALVQIAQIFGKSIVRQQRIFDKYNKMEEEVLLSYERDHKRLGEPIYKFLEDQYLPSLGEFDGFIQNTLRFFSTESTRHAKRRDELDEKPRRSLVQSKEAFLKILSSITENSGGKVSRLTMDDALLEMECLVAESTSGQILMAASDKNGADAKMQSQEAPSLVSESLPSNLPFVWRGASEEECRGLIEAIGNLKSRGMIPDDVGDLLILSVEAHGIRLAEPLKS